MWYYAPMADEPVKISRAKFTKIYGLIYKKSDYGVRFEDAHCINDPYNEDLYGKLVPIVKGSASEMIDESNISAAEI